MLDTEQRRLCDRLVSLTPTEYAQPSNLPGWRVVDLGVHITRVCDSILTAVQRGTVGDQTPAFGAAAKPREDAIRAMAPVDWVALQRDAYQQTTAQVARLSDAQLEQLSFPHPQGQRSLRWFCTQLLAEMTFHRWDIDRSLGDLVPLDDDLAAYLLPFLLDSRETPFASKRAEGPPRRFSVVPDDGPGWVLSSTASGTTVERAAAALEPRISAPSGWLALAVYGRVRVDLPPFDIAGSPQTADHFAALFGPSA